MNLVWVEPALAVFLMRAASRTQVSQQSSARSPARRFRPANAVLTRSVLSARDLEERLDVGDLLRLRKEHDSPSKHGAEETSMMPEVLCSGANWHLSSVWCSDSNSTEGNSSRPILTQRLKKRMSAQGGDTSVDSSCA